MVEATVALITGAGLCGELNLKDPRGRTTCVDVLTFDGDHHWSPGGFVWRPSTAGTEASLRYVPDRGPSNLLLVFQTLPVTRQDAGEV